MGLPVNFVSRVALPLFERMANRIRKSVIGKVMAHVHGFHIRYRWAVILIVIGSCIIVFFGMRELERAIVGLGLEQALMHFGAWAKIGEEAAEEVAKDVAKL